MFPELENGDIGAVIESFFAEIFVGEEARDVEEGGFGAVKEGEDGVAEDMFEAWAPRVTEHALQDADDFRTDVGFPRRVADFERVEGDWVSSVGRVEIDDIFDATFGDEAEIIDGEIAVWVDNTIALIVENVGERKKFEHTGFTGAGLTDDVNMARAVAAEHTELMVDATEVG